MLINCLSFYCKNPGTHFPINRYGQWGGWAIWLIGSCWTLVALSKETFKQLVDYLAPTPAVLKTSQMPWKTLTRTTAVALSPEGTASARTVWKSSFQTYFAIRHHRQHWNHFHQGLRSIFSQRPSWGIVAIGAKGKTQWLVQTHTFIYMQSVLIGANTNLNLQVRCLLIGLNILLDCINKLLRLT